MSFYNENGDLRELIIRTNENLGLELIYRAYNVTTYSFEGLKGRPLRAVYLSGGPHVKMGSIFNVDNINYVVMSIKELTVINSEQKEVPDEDGDRIETIDIICDVIVQ